MARFWIGVGLLALFLGLGLWVTAEMDRVCAPMADTLSQAAEEALQGNVEKARDLMDMAKGRWERYRKAVASVADHAPMDEIEGLFAKAGAYAKGNRAVELAAVCARLSELVEAMGEAHGLGWWNLL